ncbi:MAG: SMC-Scp complex subunit ScpB [Nitrospira sp.]|nr:SMC-Scp complex subunit ScpB [bacterium]MBL7048961.1 SMC-Scp complex subunit ScpB [Nitrospira sp.]
MEDTEAKSIIESILFMAGEPLSIDRMRNLIDVDKYNTERLLHELVSDYSTRHTGILIVEVAEGFHMVTNPACAPWVRKLLSTSVPKKLSQSSLETMAIIAYKQPIIKAEIEAIRGVNSDGVVKTLLERHLIKILGRREAPGRPLMYGTTMEFLQYFGLKNLTELPTLKEFAEVNIPEPMEQAEWVVDEGPSSHSEEEGNIEFVHDTPENSGHEEAVSEDIDAEEQIAQAETLTEEQDDEMQPIQENEDGTVEESGDGDETRTAEAGE